MAPLLLMKSITILIAHFSVLLVIPFISLSKCDQMMEKTSTNTTTTTTTTTTTGLTIDLHHLVFSPTSPLYNASQSHSQRVADALHRSSFNRRLAADAASMASSNQHSLQATANITEQRDGLFYLQYYIGNPPVSISGVLDTASDLIWTSSCSSSVKSSPILCGSPQCSLYKETNCRGNTKKSCTYFSGYASGSTIKGTLYTGSIAFTPSGDPQIPNAILGCGTDSDSTIGIVGLGSGPISLVRQFGSSKLGFCLAPFGNTSKLHLGDNAVAAGGVVVPLVPSENQPSSYGVSVGSIIVGNSNKQIYLGGNMLIDTGTTMTMFPESFYIKFLKAVNASIGDTFPKSKDPKAPSGFLCYANLPSNLTATIVFGNNKRLTWKPENLFLQFGEYSWCLSAGISTIEESIYGSTALTNFAVGLDLDLKVNTVTFLPTACAGK